MTSAPPSPSIVSAPDPPVIVLAPVLPRMLMALLIALASMFVKSFAVVTTETT